FEYVLRSYLSFFSQVYSSDGTPELFSFPVLACIFVPAQPQPCGNRIRQIQAKTVVARPEGSNRTTHARVAPIRAGSCPRFRKSPQPAWQVLVFVGLSHPGDDLWHSPRRSRIDRSSRRAPNGRGNEPLAPHLPGGFPSTEHGPQSKG